MFESAYLLPVGHPMREYSNRAARSSIEFRGYLAESPGHRYIQLYRGERIDLGRLTISRTPFSYRTFTPTTSETLIFKINFIRSGYVSFLSNFASFSYLRPSYFPAKVRFFRFLNNQRNFNRFR